ncbi:hypothetical protein X943_001056 [Babesia divergens]|uniref:Uncharacterized protein n=1 Tax=Babesia divergens TaxID=32595 RepID=A0AAD9GH93_BABDI|nr:hypothetical protein X943_001056 [Babesia divergens]
MSMTGRSAVSRGSVPSVHSWLFAFHVKEIAVHPSLKADIGSSSLKLLWELSDNISDLYGGKSNEKKENTLCSTHTSPSFEVDNDRVVNVDTAFALLQCRRTRMNKMGISSGGLNIRVVLDNDKDMLIASAAFDLRLLEVAATLNIHAFRLKDRNDAIVGSIDICYVSQQRWIKVNKRKLSFLNDQRTSGIKSMVETSAKYVTSALDGKEPTPSTKEAVVLNALTPREDDFVLLFWNSTNTCFLKQHPDDYQLQLMLNFVRTPFVRDGLMESSRTDERESHSDQTPSLDLPASFPQFSDFETSSSRPVPNSAVLQLPNIQCANTNNSAFTPTSDMVSDFTDDDATMRSGLSPSTKSSSVRLYDYLSEQNMIIQSHLTRQLSVDAMSTSSWTSCSRMPATKDISLPTMPNTTEPIPAIAFSIVDSCTGNTGRTYMDVESDVSSVANSFRDIDMYSHMDDISFTNRSSDILFPRSKAITEFETSGPFDKHANNIAHSASDPPRRMDAFVLGHTSDANYRDPMHQPSRPVKRVNNNVSSDGFEVPTFIPRFSKTQKTALAANASVSTFDSSSTCDPINPSRSFNSFELDVPVNSSHGIILSKDSVNKPLDVCSNAESLLDTMSNLDIVEDMFCSVVIEDAGYAPVPATSIDVNRFYSEKDDFAGDFMGSTCNGSSTINNIYMDDAEMDNGISDLIRTVTLSPNSKNTNNLNTSIHNAIMADISSLSLSDLGVEYAECSLDVMSEALNDAKAMQIQQDRLSNELLLNFFLQLLNCYSQKGVPQALFMHNIVQKHLSAAELMKFLPENYNATVIRVALDILIRQLSMELPAGKSDHVQLGTDYIMPQNTTNSNSRTVVRSETIHNEMIERNSIDFFRPLSECETYSEASDADECFLPTKEVRQSQMRMQRFQNILHNMYQHVDEMDPRKLVYISRLHSKPLKKRGCNLSLLDMKIALYRVFCGRRKLATSKPCSLRI